MGVARTLFTALAGFLVYAVVKRLIRGLLNPLSQIPGPWHTRYTGFVSKLYRITGKKTVWAHAQFQKYGPVVRLEPAQVGFAELEFYEEMNRMGAGFRKTSFHEKMRIGPDHMLFSITDVRQHGARRKLFARSLTLDALRKNWESRIRDKVERCVDQIRKEAESGLADVCKWWRLMAGDVIALISFGESFEMVENGAKSENEYFKALENAGVNLVLNDLVPLLKVWAAILPFKRLKDIVDANSVITEKGTIAVTNLRNAELDKANIFTNVLVEAEKERTGEKETNILTDDAIRSEAAGFLLAGADTTGLALTYLVWAVLKRPELQRRLEDEMAGLPAGFTDKDVEKLPLVNNVIDETLRLYSPTAGSILRTVPQGGLTWRNYFIPEGTIVITQQWTRIRDEQFFPDPERFDESRFQNATEKQRRVAQPFGLGTRSCIGVHLAKIEMRLATALFFRKCRGVRMGKNMTDEMMEQLMKFFTIPKGNKMDITFVEALSQ